jgi:hypothetical protein
VARVWGLSGVGGGGAHDSIPHNPTQGGIEQRHNVHQLRLTGTYEHNCTFFGSNELAVKNAPSVHHTLLSASSSWPLHDQGFISMWSSSAVPTTPFTSDPVSLRALGLLLWDYACTNYYWTSTLKHSFIQDYYMMSRCLFSY